MTTPKPGTVYLVGAGPGDPGLITVRGLNCLRVADVIVYDNLANAELLRHAPPSAEAIYAGKQADQHTKSQEEINELLAEKAAAGLTVVRLKGGDPFLFGRGGEEAEYLTAREIPWQVVPGITSAIAVPAYAGIPVTHRLVNGSLHVVTGHENVKGLGEDIDWATFARSRGTIVMLMGIKNLGPVTTHLQDHGMSPDTPVAIIQWGTRAEQKTLTTTVGQAVADVQDAGLRPPAITVIGEVVRLRETLAWAEKRPLFGWRIAVTRPAGENDRLVETLEAAGAEVVWHPTLRLAPVEPDETSVALMAALTRPAPESWLTFTSANGVSQFHRVWMSAGYDFRALAGVRIAGIGDRTAEALESRGLRCDLVAGGANQESLSAALIKAGARHVTIARAKIARPVLEDELAQAGIAVQALPVYDMQPDEHGIRGLTAALVTGRIHAVTFTSARTFEVVADHAREAGLNVKELFGDCTLAVLGPITAKAIEKAGLPAPLIAPETTMDSLAETVIGHGLKRSEV